LIGLGLLKVDFDELLGLMPPDELQRRGGRRIRFRRIGLMVKKAKF